MNDWCLVDTNVLVYSELPDSPYFLACRNYLEKNLPLGNLCLTIQNLLEFYAISTDQKRVDSPKSPEEVAIKIRKILESGAFHLLLQKERTSITILDLIKKHSVGGADIYDLALAAVMADNGIKTVCTLDAKIFSKLGLKVINPLK